MSENDPRPPTPIAMDNRPIIMLESVSADADGDPSFFFSTKPGRWKNCDTIESYQEPEQMAMIPFYAVFSGGLIIARVAANCAVAHYAPPEKKED